MLTVLAVAVATWGIAMAVAPLLQIRAIRAHESSAGVSVVHQQVLLVGFLLWLAYGIALQNAALIASNVVAAAVTTATIAVALRFRP